MKAARSDFCKNIVSVADIRGTTTPATSTEPGGVAWEGAVREGCVYAIES